MTKLIPVNDEEVQCRECEVVFTLFWQRNAWTRAVEYCPFCGEEVTDQEADG